MPFQRRAGGPPRRRVPRSAVGRLLVGLAAGLVGGFVSAFVGALLRRQASGS